MTRPPDSAITLPSTTSTTSTASGGQAAGESTARTSVTTASDSGLVGLVVWWTRTWRALRDRSRAAVSWAVHTITPAGWLVLIAATAGVGMGVVFGWVEWMVAGVASIAMLALCIPFLFGTRAYDVEVHLTHERVVTGDEVEAEILVRNRGRGTALPGRLDLPVGDGLIELGVPLMRAGSSVSQPVMIPALRRGIITVGPPMAVRTDPVGLVRREHAWDDIHRLYVHPRTVGVPSTSAGMLRDLEGQPTRRLVDADMSFHAIREYAPGDSRRQIHWKSTAKTGQLMVRQFEESRRSRMAVILSVAEHEFADAAEFELAVSAAASLSVQAVRDGRDLDVITGTDIPRVVRGRLRALQNIAAPSPRALLDGFCPIEQLANTMPVEGVCRLTAESHQALSIAVVVCGSKVSQTRLRKAALAFPADTAVIAVVCDEQAHPRTQLLGSFTVLTIGVLEDLPNLMLRGGSS